MQTKTNIAHAFARNFATHVVAAIIFAALLQLTSLSIALLAVGTAYSFWMNLYAYWRIFRYDTSPTTWNDKSGYVASVIFFTAISCAGLPYLAWKFLTPSLLWLLIAYFGVNFLVAFIGFGLGKRFEPQGD